MINVFLIRHGNHDWLARGIAGRTPDVNLNEKGRIEAVQLGNELIKLRDRVSISALYSSPIDRTVETAQLISPSLDLPVTTDNEFIEIDYGQWTGKTFSELKQEPLWKVWNERRSTMRVPGGETIQEVQSRIVKRLFALSIERSFQSIAIVSHGDPIKCVISYAGLYSLDNLASHAIKPASVTLIQITDQKINVIWYGKTADELASCQIPIY